MIRIDFLLLKSLSEHTDKVIQSELMLDNNGIPLDSAIIGPNTYKVKPVFVRRLQRHKKKFHLKYDLFEYEENQKN